MHCLETLLQRHIGNDRSGAPQVGLSCLRKAKLSPTPGGRTVRGSIFLGLTLSYSPSLNRRPFNSIVVAHMQTQLKMLGSVLVHHHLHHHHQFNLLTSSAVSPLHRLFQRSLTTLSSSTTVHTSIITFYSYLLYFLNR